MNTEVVINTAWENAFASWAKPPAQTEQDRCENAVKAVRNAIAASTKLKYKNIKVISQGSYRNNTNVKNDSDVDLGVLCEETFFFNLPEGYTRDNFRIGSATYSYEEFKNDVQRALITYFGTNTISRGNKAFNIHETSYHVDADVAPFFEHRRYSTDGSYLSGMELLADDGQRIINWPEQHYQNGITKNEATGKRFKSVVRILKKLANHMEEEKSEIAKLTPGFLIECLVWNVPNSNFGNGSYYEDVRNCLAFLFNNTLTEDKCLEWGEVNELKYLFRGSQKWKWQQAHNFIDAAWNRIGLK